MLEEYRNANANPARRAEPRVRTSVGALLLRAIHRWQRSRAMAELSRLDDRQLEDIGLTRNDIPRAVRGLFAQEEQRHGPGTDKASVNGDGEADPKPAPLRRAA